MDNINVLISGSGIASSTFAYWLLRADPKAKITIVERDPHLRLTGASVDIRNAAVDVIKWMGIEEKIREQGTNEKGISFVNGDDSVIGTFESTGKTEVQSFTSEYEIFRGGLAKILIDEIQDQVKLIFDEYVETYEEQDDGVTVTFARSKEVEKYDLLVAADGLGSKIRGIMLGARSRDQVQADQGAYAAYFTVERDLLAGSALAKWYNATKGRCIFIRPDPDPRGRTRINLVSVYTTDDKSGKEKLEKAMDDGHESYKALLEEKYHDAGWLAPEILKLMHGSKDFYYSFFAQVKSPKLVTGRVALIGDAGYATPGFGTSLALMGGYALAGELCRTPNDLQAALKRYEELVLPFARSNQSIPGNAYQLVNPQTAWGIGIRNGIIKFVTTLQLDKLMANAGAALGFTEKKISFPDYPWPTQTEKLSG